LLIELTACWHFLIPFSRKAGMDWMGREKLLAKVSCSRLPFTFRLCDGQLRSFVALVIFVSVAFEVSVHSDALLFLEKLS